MSASHYILRRLVSLLQTSPEARAESAGCALLIVDCESPVERGRRVQLEEDGYEVRTEVNRLPLTLEPGWTPDLVFIDLPNATALELGALLRYVREAVANEQVPIVACSPWTSAELREAGFGCSDLDFVVSDRRHAG